ncbi:hypothetical protein F4782DRAFT_510243 [Xylaria castorea]|nr:hypothetical protein F4782DRAFT_510243 [Xylaria castorea]
MLPDPTLLYQPGNPFAPVPYTGPAAPGFSNHQIPPSLPDSFTEEGEPAWTEDKHRLERRFGSSRLRHDSSGQVARSTALLPYNEPLPYDRGEEQFAPRASLVPHSEPPPAMVDMHSFTKWIGDHAADYHKSGRVTELAGRVRHNMRDFTEHLEAYRAMRETARRERRGPQWTNEMEEIYHRALHVEVLYDTTVGRYDGPFKRKGHCSNTEKAEAQQLLKAMFGRDYNIWDGFNWHMLYWISQFRHVCP